MDKHEHARFGKALEELATWGGRPRCEALQEYLTRVGSTSTEEIRTAVDVINELIFAEPDKRYDKTG